MTKSQNKFDKLPLIEQYKWIYRVQVAHNTVFFCPKCGSLLTGLHEQKKHFQDYLKKEAVKLWKQSVNGDES